MLQTASPLTKFGHRVSRTASGLNLVVLGGPGSGNFGHAGIPGHQGGSAPGEPVGMKAAEVLYEHHVRLHNGAAREYKEAFAHVGARMWHDDDAHPIGTKGLDTRESREILKRYWADKTLDHIREQTAIVRPLTVLDAYPHVTDQQRAWLDRRVNQIHSKYQGEWDKILGEHETPRALVRAAARKGLGETHVHKIADAWRPRLKMTILRAVAKARADVQVGEVEAALRASDEPRVLAAVLPAIERLRGMRLPLLDILAESARATRLPGLRVLGGPGSGNFGHAGRPGEVGGSGEGGEGALNDRQGLIDKLQKSITWDKPQNGRVIVARGGPEPKDGPIFLSADAEMAIDYSDNGTRGLATYSIDKNSLIEEGTSRWVRIFGSLESEGPDFFVSPPKVVMDYVAKHSFAGIASSGGQYIHMTNRGVARLRHERDWTEHAKHALKTLGGPGSGNFGHVGRPGEVGGSAPDEGGNSKESERAVKDILVKAVGGPRRVVNIDALQNLSNEQLAELHHHYGVLERLRGDNAGRLSAELARQSVVREQERRKDLIITDLDFTVSEQVGGKGYSVSIAGGGEIKLGMVQGQTHAGIGDITLPQELRGRGLGQALYVKAAQVAIERGRQGILSDPQVRSSSATAAWERLIKKSDQLRELGLIITQEKIPGIRGVYYTLEKIKLRAAGGPGSGNFGHAGRPGEVGGSAEGDAGDPTKERGFGWDKEKLAQLSPAARDVWERAVDKMNSSQPGVHAVDARKTTPADRRALAELGLSATTDRMSIPMMGVSAKTRVELFKKRVEYTRAHRNAIRTAAGPTLSMLFNVTNKYAVAWVAAHAGELIKEFADVNAIRTIVKRAFTEGFAPRIASRLIRDSIGLTTPQSEAVGHLYERLITATGDTVQAGSKTIRVPFDPSDEFLEKVTSAYSDRLLRSRAETIAHTESMRASNEGQLELWDQAIEHGFLTGTELKQWIATPDKVVCDECADMDEETVGLDEEFSSGDDAPPLHPNCRCTVGLVAARTAEEKS